MLGTELNHVSQAILGHTLSILSETGTPSDLWPLIMDSVSLHVKDISLADISEQERDWRNKVAEMGAQSVREDERGPEDPVNER